MPLIREFDALVRGTGRLWWRFLPQVITWLVMGWLLYTGALIGSTALGHGIASMVVFGLGIAASVLGQIFAILSLKPGLQALHAVGTGAEGPRGGAHQLPSTVFERERAVDVAILTVGPVLGVYALWEILDEMIRDGFFWNAVIRTVGDTENWSVSLRPELLTGYLAVGVVALVLRLGWARLVRNRPPVWRIPLVAFEGLWVFATFFIVLMVLRQGRTWLSERNVWRNWITDWHAFLDWLPDIRLPFDLTLPEFLAESAQWFWEVFFPAAWQGVALPLVWLAVVAMVMGWRDFHIRDLLFGGTGGATATDRPRRPLDRAISVATADLRDKYVPLLAALRLIWRSGAYVLGAYLIAYAVLEIVAFDVRHLLYRVTASGEETGLHLTLLSVDLVGSVVMGSLRTCLLVCAFDRAVTDTVRHHVAPAGARPNRPLSAVVGQLMSTRQ